MRVFVTNLMMLNEQERFASIFAEKGIEPIFKQAAQALSEEELLPLMGEFDGWVAGDDAVTAKVLDAALPRLKVIAKWGTGVDSFDLAAAKQRGVPVFNAPGAFQHAVSEVALGYMLGLSRHLGEVDRAVRKGEWPKPCGVGLYGRTVGIIGFGAIGRGVAERAQGCGMEVLAYDPMQPPVPSHITARYGEVDEVISHCDVLVFCCNRTPENYHMLNAQRIANMRDGAMVVNVARGGLIDEDALLAALQSGKIAAAGLDVFEVEPLVKNSPFKTMENVMLGSHNANNQHAAIEAVHAHTLECLYQGLGLAAADNVPISDKVAA